MIGLLLVDRNTHFPMLRNKFDGELKLPRNRACAPKDETRQTHLRSLQVICNTASPTFIRTGYSGALSATVATVPAISLSHSLSHSPETQIESLD